MTDRASDRSWLCQGCQTEKFGTFITHNYVDNYINVGDAEHIMRNSDYET